jgi:hypothetical protein
MFEPALGRLSKSPSPPIPSAGGKPATEGQQDLVDRRRKVMHNVDTAARRDHPLHTTSGLDANLIFDISRTTAKPLEELWQRAMKNSPRADELRDDGLRKAAQRIVKEIRARRNLRSVDGTELASSLGAV